MQITKTDDREQRREATHQKWMAEWRETIELEADRGVMKSIELAAGWSPKYAAMLAQKRATAEVRKAAEAVAKAASPVQKAAHAENHLDALVTKHAQDAGVDRVRARAAVLDTAEGRAAYAELHKAQHERTRDAARMPGVLAKLDKLDGIAKLHAERQHISVLKAREEVANSTLGRQIMAEIDAEKASYRPAVAKAHPGRILKGAALALDNAIKAHMTEGVTVAKATAALMATPEGAELYRRAYLEQIGGGK